MDSQPTDTPPADAKKKSFMDRFRRSPAPAENLSSEPAAPAKEKLSFTQRMRKALSRTGEGLGSLFLGGKTIDEGLLEELETLLRQNV